MVPVRLTVVAFLDLGVRAEDHDADVVGFEVERHALHPVRELDHLAGLDLIETVDAGDTVTDRQHRADFRDLGLGAEAGDLVLDDLRDFSGADFHGTPFVKPVGLSASALHGLGERIETGTDRAVDHAAADLDDEAAQNGRIDAGLDGDGAALACLELFGRAASSALHRADGPSSLRRVTSPRAAAAIAVKARTTSGSEARRRLAASTPRKLRVSGEQLEVAPRRRPTGLGCGFTRHFGVLQISAAKSANSRTAAAQGYRGRLRPPSP